MKFPRRATVTLLGSHASARGALAKIRPGQLVPDMPRNAEPRMAPAVGDLDADGTLDPFDL